MGHRPKTNAHILHAKGYNIKNVEIRPIDPHSQQKIGWDLFVGVCTVYSIVSTIIYFAADNMILSNEILYFDAAIDIIFILDILIGFCTAYMKDDGKLENSFPKIWKNYFKGYFALDFIASIPISLLLLIFQTLTEILRANKFLRLVRIPKLLRIYRTYRQIRDIAKHMEILNHDEEKMHFSPADVAAAYVAFASKYTDILPIEHKNQNKTFKWKARDVLAHQF